MRKKSTRDKDSSLTESIASAISSLPFFKRFHRRFLIIVFSALWFVSLTRQWPKLTEIQLSIPFQIGSSNLLLIGKAILSLVLGFLTVVLLLTIIKFTLSKEEARLLEVSEEDLTKLKELAVLCYEMGIERILPSDTNKSSLSQKWAIDIRNELSKTKTVKILGIAGYENIGLGPGKAFLHDILQAKKDEIDHIEIVLLNPATSRTDVVDDQCDVISKRIIEISKDGYDERQLKIEMNKSFEIIKKLYLFGRKRNISLYYYDFTPVFRMIMFDSLSFVGTYKRNRHGHETPILKLAKESDESLSLYYDFQKYFCLIKSLSNKVDLA